MAESRMMEPVRMLAWLRAILTQIVRYFFAVIPTSGVFKTEHSPDPPHDVMRQQNSEGNESGASPGDAEAVKGKQEFLAAHGTDYGYGGRIDKLRKEEFGRLKHRVYVDHAGATLYSEKQLADVFKELTAGVYGNPHSQHGLLEGQGSAAAEAEARALTLAMVNASSSDYECVFTSGATGAIKLVAEAFPWSPQSRFVYTLDNHNSVLGVREVALDAGATALAVEPHPASPSQGYGGWELRQASPVMRRQNPSQSPSVNPSQPPKPAHHLFAFPLESNFSGARYDPALPRALYRPPHAPNPPASLQTPETPPRPTNAPEAHPSEPCGPFGPFPRGPSREGGENQGSFARLGDRTANAQGREPYARGLSPEGGEKQASSADPGDRRGNAEGRGGRDTYPGPGNGTMDEQGTGARASFASAGDEMLDGWIGDGVEEGLVVDCGRGGGAVEGAGTGGEGRESGESGEGVRGNGEASGGAEVPRGGGRGEAEEGGESGEGVSGRREIGEEGQAARRTGERWWVLLDAAKACCSSPPDLSRHPADFVVLSFYKIFGYPTGLGALLVRKEALPHLRKAYFGGGTVAVSVADADFFRRRSGAAGLEDGTAAYLGLAAVPRGFAQIAAVGGFPSIERHTACLTRYTAEQLGRLRHANGRPVCELYGAHAELAAMGAHVGDHMGPLMGAASVAGAVGQGPVVAFSILRADSSFVGYREVEKLAALRHLLLRTGCFCNPGACARHLGLTPAQLRANYEAGHVCWDDRDVVDGRPTGAVRVSFGYMSTYEDARAVVDFIEDYFVEKEVQAAASGDGKLPGFKAVEESGGAVLEGIWVYPIKSCAGFSPREWPLTTTGLLWDRAWALVDETGRTLTQKRHPRLATIQTHLDLDAGTLLVSAPSVPEPLLIPLPGTATGESDVSSALDKGSPKSDGSVGQLSVKVCGEDVCGLEVQATYTDDEMMLWWRRAVGVPCRLVRHQAGSRTAVKRPPLSAPWPSGMVPPSGESGEGSSNADLSFANEGQLLLLNSASLADLNRRLAEVGAPAVTSDRFRPNLVIGGPSLEAFEEDAWSGVQIGDTHFDSAGPCARCEMVTLDQSTGARGGVEPLRTLAAYRRQKGRIFFGALLNCRAGLPSSDHRLRVEDLVLPT